LISIYAFSILAVSSFIFFAPAVSSFSPLLHFSRLTAESGRLSDQSIGQ